MKIYPLQKVFGQLIKVLFLWNQNHLPNEIVSHTTQCDSAITFAMTQMQLFEFLP